MDTTNLEIKKLKESLQYSESVKMNNFNVLIQALIVFYIKSFTFHQMNNSIEFSNIF